MSNIKHSITIQGTDNRVVFEVGEANSVTVFVPDPSSDTNNYGFSAQISVDELCDVADQLRQRLRDKATSEMFKEN